MREDGAEGIAASRYIPFVLLLLSVGVVAGVTATSGPEPVNSFFAAIVGLLDTVLMREIPYTQMPVIVAVLFGGAVFFTFRFRFISVRAFGHALKVVAGTYDNPDDPGDVNHLQALSSALSATVGLGNIAGVAIAVSMGGPGAIFWMMVVAVFGMSSKFAECTLGQIYRQTDSAGEMRGGPMVYLKEGLAKRGWDRLGVFLSVTFCILCIGTSLGAGNMFQANQSFQLISEQVPALAGEHATGEMRLESNSPIAIDQPDHQVRIRGDRDQDGDPDVAYGPAGERLTLSKADWSQTTQGTYAAMIPIRARNSGNRSNIPEATITSFEVANIAPGQFKIDGDDWKQPDALVRATNPSPIGGGEPHNGWIFGIILAAMIGVVIIGGIKSIAWVAEKIVPFMCLLYITAGLFIIFYHPSEVVGAVEIILNKAFQLEAGWGALIGVFIQGVRRAAFSSEAGIGSAPIAHSAAKTDEPVREGVVAMLGPFIDTVIVCFITGMVIVVSGVWNDPTLVGVNGVTLTAKAFGAEISWFPQVLTVAVTLFAFSTMISWSYYGERCWTYLFGDDQAMMFRLAFVLFVVFGSITTLGNVLAFGDYFLLAMAFPNILGVVIMSGEVDERLRDYWNKFKQGEFD
jgi:Na+/alanine symporter